MQHALVQALKHALCGAFLLAVLAGATHAQDAKQIRLTETHIKNFIAAQKDLAALTAVAPEPSNEPDEKFEAEIDAIAKRHGFANGSELRDVDYSIFFVLDGLDPQSGEFFDPLEGLKAELEDIKGDKDIPADQKEQFIKEREEAIKLMPPLEHKENIDMVKQHREEIEKALQ